MLNHLIVNFKRSISAVHHFLCIVTLAFAPCWTYAVEFPPLNSSESSFRFSGFGTLGLTNTNGPDDWGYRRNISQPSNSGGVRADTDSLIGFQINYSPNPQFELVGQVIATRRANYGKASDNIEWAFAAYHPTPDVTMRIGRVNIDAFLLANYRNVGFAYRYVRPPVDFYASLPHSLDGIDISKSISLENSEWNIKTYAGRSHGGDLDIDSRVTVKPVYGLTISREAGGLTLRTGIAYSGIKNSANALDPILTGLNNISNLAVNDLGEQAQILHSRLDSSDDHAVYYSFSTNYEKDNWLWTMELTKVSGHPTTNMSAGYTNIGKRFGSVTLFAGIGKISTPNLPVSTPDWESQLSPIIGATEAQKLQSLASSAVYSINSSGANQHTFSVGGRWDFNPKMALKVQWDHISIDEYGGRLWTNSTLNSGRSNVTSITLDFIF